MSTTAPVTIEQSRLAGALVSAGPAALAEAPLVFVDNARRALEQAPRAFARMSEAVV